LLYNGCVDGHFFPELDGLIVCPFQIR
jgi:hypothetical protein